MNKSSFGEETKREIHQLEQRLEQSGVKAAVDWLYDRAQNPKSLPEAGIPIREEETRVDLLQEEYDEDLSEADYWKAVAVLLHQRIRSWQQNISYMNDVMEKQLSGDEGPTVSPISIAAKSQNKKIRERYRQAAGTLPDFPDETIEALEAWEEGGLTEGQAETALRTSRLAARTLREIWRGSDQHS